MRARRSSSSDSAVSIVNGRIAAASADRSAMTAMWVLLGEYGGEVAPAACSSRPHTAPVENPGLLTGLLTCDAWPPWRSPRLRRRQLPAARLLAAGLRG